MTSEPTETAEDWIRRQVAPSGPIEAARVRPWSTVRRVPVSGGAAWFKACNAVQAFEPRLTSELFARWHDRVAEVIARDDERGWLLLADAGSPLGARSNPVPAWLAALPRYAELQRGESRFAADHVAFGVPALPVTTLPAGYAALLDGGLPLDRDELARLRAFGPRFDMLCAELATDGLPSTVQHDDLHMGNLFEQDGRYRVLDWGDSSIAHPFFSLVVTFRFLEECNGLWSGGAQFARLRDAYLEPWGTGLTAAFTLAQRVGSFAHCIALARQRDHLPPEARPEFDIDFARYLRRALRVTITSS